MIMRLHYCVHNYPQCHQGKCDADVREPDDFVSRSLQCLLLFKYITVTRFYNFSSLRKLKRFIFITKY